MNRPGGPRSGSCWQACALVCRCRSASYDLAVVRRPEHSKQVNLATSNADQKRPFVLLPEHLELLAPPQGLRMRLVKVYLNLARTRPERVSLTDENERRTILFGSGSG